MAWPRMCCVAPLAELVAPSSRVTVKAKPHFLPIQAFVVHQSIFTFTLIIIIITRPKLAYGQQGLERAAHFAPPALSLEVGSDDFS